MIRVAIINESEFLRLGLRSAMEVGEDIEVVGDFEPDATLIERVSELGPDLVLMGMRSPVLDTLRSCRHILEAMPSIKVLILSSTRKEDDVLACMMAGASGCLNDNASGEELNHAIQAASNGRLHFEWGVAENVLTKLQRFNDSGYSSHLEVLSERETLILTLIGSGYSNKEIGIKLGLATATVRNNITRIRSKLDLHSRARLVKFAIDKGLRLAPEDHVEK